MKRLLILLAFFSPLALALNVDLTGGLAEVIAADKIQIRNIKVGSLATPVVVQLTWNAEANALVITDVVQQPFVGFLGIWNVTIQKNCAGDWAEFTSIEVLADGTCRDRGLACTWRGDGNRLFLSWTNYPNYVIEADLIEGALVGTIVASGAKWCWRGERAASVIENLSRTPNMNAIPYRL